LGQLHNHEFKNFELQLQVLTRRHANSGVYFHTAWQPEDWPAQGFEVQVNNSHADPSGRQACMTSKTIMRRSLAMTLGSR